MSAAASLGVRKTEAGTGAGDTARIERHHRIPRRLLAAHDGMTRHTEIDGEALQAWFDFEEMCLEHGLDPDASREELEAAVARRQRPSSPTKSTARSRTGRTGRGGGGKAA